MAVLARVRRALQAHAERGGAAPVPPADDLTGAAEGAPEEAPEAIAAGMADPPALVQLCAAFGLSPFERDLLTLCAGVELDAAVAPLCAQAQGDPQRPYPTFSLALAALPGAHWSAVTPGAPLRHWQLIEVQAGSLPAGSPLTRSPLRVDERVLHFLAGTPSLDERLAGTGGGGAPAGEPGPLPPGPRRAPGQRVDASPRRGAPAGGGAVGGQPRGPPGGSRGGLRPGRPAPVRHRGRDPPRCAGGAGVALPACGPARRHWAAAALLVECDLLDSADAARMGAAGQIRAPGAGPAPGLVRRSPCRRWAASAGAWRCPAPPRPSSTPSGDAPWAPWRRPSTAS